MNMEEYEKAISKLEIALELQPLGYSAFVTSLKLGSCYQKLQKYDKALEYFEKGKLLTERMMPSTRELYLNQTEKYLSDLRKIMKKTDNKA